MDYSFFKKTLENKTFASETNPFLAEINLNTTLDLDLDQLINELDIPTHTSANYNKNVSKDARHLQNKETVPVNTRLLKTPSKILAN